MIHEDSLKDSETANSGLSGTDKNLFKRKGKLIVPMPLILDANESTLREIFTNFFPIDADRYHQYQYWDSIVYHGVSPHFEEVEEACIIPEYQMVLDMDENGNVKFNRFDKQK
jgi:hypothetical protein